jgi:hypothetical protein
MERKASLTLLFCAVAVMAGAVLFFFDPAKSGFYPGCPLHRLTGLNCPGCGGLRAVHELLHGNIAAAWRLNLLLVLSLPLAAALLIKRLFVSRSRKPQPTGIENKPHFWVIFFVVLIVFGILRNVPLFAWMSP